MNKNERQIAEENFRAYTRARDSGHLDYLRDAERQDKFYRGEQWEEKDIQALSAQGRPHLTINTILSVVNTMIGEQETQRVDPRFKPRRDGVHETAQALTKLTEQILDNNKYPYVESMVFADGLIEDRGYFDIRMDFDDHIEGEIRITEEDPREIMPDPHARSYDPRTWNEVTKASWMTLEDIEAVYSKELRQKVEAVAYAGEHFGSDSVRMAGEATFGTTETAFETNDPAKDDPGVVRSVRVIERQYRKLAMTRFFVDNETGDMRAIPETMAPERIRELQQIANLSVIQKLTRRIRWTVTADSVVLKDEWSPYKTFTIVPYFPYFRRGRPFGVVKNLLSPQEQLNKIESQQLHVVNTTANSGWTAEAGTLVNMTEEELEERGAETGLVIIHKQGTKPPQRITANAPPSGLDRLGSKALAFVREISGVESMLGTDHPEVSGVAIKQKQTRAMVQMQVPFTSLKRSRQMVVEKVLELIQDFYTETRVIQVTNWEDPQRGTEELTINGISPEGRVVNDVTLGEYDVVIATAPARDTFGDSQFAEMLQMREVGIHVPDDEVILASNIDRKFDIAQRIREELGLDPSPEQQELMAAMQELQMAMAQAELAEKQAGAELKAAQAQLAASKAGNEESLRESEGQRAALEAQLEAQRLRTQVAMHMANLVNKLQLAQFHGDVKREITQYTTAAKSMNNQLSLRSRAQGRPNPQ